MLEEKAAAAAALRPKSASSFGGKSAMEATETVASITMKVGMIGWMRRS